MKTIAVLLTVHNRKEKTLQCLKNLFAQQYKENYEIDVYLTDDGCTDGTREEVLKQYPLVKIVSGDGTLYWNRGMYRAWEMAARTKEYTFYLWLNDDTMLFKDAVLNIVNTASETNNKAIICGATCSLETQQVTYSGSVLSQKSLIVPNGTIQECNIVNGNFLLVPKVIYETIGNLDWTFRHAVGDYDYGLRAQKAGFKCYVAPSYAGICESNPTLPKWCLKTTPLLKRFRLLYSPLGYAEPIPFFIYENRHFGLLTAIKHLYSIHLRALMPQLWK